MATPCKLVAATNSMVKAGITLPDTQSLIQHVIHLLQTDGPLYLETIKALVKTISFFSEHDLSGILTSLAVVGADFSQIVKDFKVEFGIQ